MSLLEFTGDSIGVHRLNEISYPPVRKNCMTPSRSALVTGATGFIGSALVRKLVSQGVQTCALVRNLNGAIQESLYGAEVIASRTTDVKDLKSCLDGRTYEVAFHLAAAGVSRGIQSPESIISGNVSFTTNLLLVTKEWNLKRFVYTGSAFEYGDTGRQQPIDESTPLRPRSLYAAAKAAASQCGEILAKELQIPFANLRMFGVYGVGESSQRLIPYLIQCLSQNSFANLSHGKQIRDMLYIDDVVAAIIATGECDRLPVSGVYNVCSSVPVNIREIAGEVVKKIQSSERLLKWGANTAPDVEARYIVGANTKITTLTDWRPSISLTAGIERMVSFYTPARQHTA